MVIPSPFTWLSCHFSVSKWKDTEIHLPSWWDSPGDWDKVGRRGVLRKSASLWFARNSWDLPTCALAHTAVLVQNSRCFNPSLKKKKKKKYYLRSPSSGQEAAQSPWQLSYPLSWLHLAHFGLIRASCFLSPSFLNDGGLPLIGISHIITSKYNKLYKNYHVSCKSSYLCIMLQNPIPILSNLSISWTVVFLFSWISCFNPGRQLSPMQLFACSPPTDGWWNKSEG